jgi:hypothetical protein
VLHAVGEEPVPNGQPKTGGMNRPRGRNRGTDEPGSGQ